LPVFVNFQSFFRGFRQCLRCMSVAWMLREGVARDGTEH